MIFLKIRTEFVTFFHNLNEVVGATKHSNRFWRLLHNKKNIAQKEIAYSIDKGFSCYSNALRKHIYVQNGVRDLESI